MNPIAASFLTVAALAGLHWLAGTSLGLHEEQRRSLISAAAGISITYVFLELMPDLAEKQILVEGSGFLSGLERHVYIFALIGLIIGFWIETVSRKSRRRQRAAAQENITDSRIFWVSMILFSVFNASVGYAIASPNDLEIQPLWVFAIAMGLHFLANDHSLAEHHGYRYQHLGRWLLGGALLAGWVIGIIPQFEVPETALALVLAYIAGGTVFNVLRHELPDTDRQADVGAFLVGVVVYSLIILALAPQLVQVAG